MIAPSQSASATSTSTRSSASRPTRELPKARGALFDGRADRAAGEVVVKMLPVLDAFDLAAQHFSSARPKRPRLGSGEGDYYSTHSRRRDWSESTPWCRVRPASTRRVAHVEVMTALWSIRCFAPVPLEGFGPTSRNGESSS